MPYCRPDYLSKQALLASTSKGILNLDEIKNTLWLYSTRQQHPFQDHEAFAALKDHGDVVIDGLIWALKQDDFDLKLLALSLFKEFYPDAKRAIPTLRAQISDAVDVLVRAYTISTLPVGKT